MFHLQDLVAHHGLTIHTAQPNVSEDRQRRAIAVVFEGASAVRDPTLLANIRDSLTAQGLPGAESNVAMLARDKAASTAGERGDSDRAADAEVEDGDQDSDDDGGGLAALMGGDLKDNDDDDNDDFEAGDDVEDLDIEDASDDEANGPAAAKKTRLD